MLRSLFKPSPLKNNMIGHSTLRLTFTLVTCLMFLSRGFVIDKRIASQDVRNFQDLNRLNNYDDEDYEDDLLKNNYYYDRGMNAMNSNKREFSPDKLRQQVRDKMEAIVRGKDVSSFFDDDIESEMFDSMMRKMMKDKHEAMKNIGNLKSSSSFREEKSSQTKIESNGNKGVAVVTGQSMESSSSGNGSNPLVKVAKVVAVATKDGKENGEWKMKPIEEEVQVITPAPEDGKQALKNVGGDDDDEEKFKSLFEQDDRGLFHGHDFDRLFGPEEVERSPRNKRSILAAEEPKKSANDVDLLKNYIALQDAENRHLMQALDLASEIELNNEDDPRTIDEQMYHMRKALEEERSLSAIRKQIQLSIKNSGAKRSPYMFKQNDYPAEDLQKYAVPGDNDDDDDYDNGADYSFLKRYSKRRVSGAEDYNDDDDGDDDDDDVIEEGETVKEDEDGNLMEEWAGDITLDRHKLRNEELIDRLKEMMSQSDEGWKSISRSKKPHPVDHSVDELLDEESLRNLLRSYRKNYKTLNDDKVLPLIFPDDDEEYDEGDIDPQLRRKILENMARHSISGWWTSWLLDLLRCSCCFFNVSL